MSWLRRFALAGVGLAVAAILVGGMTGRRVERDAAGCDLEMLEGLPGAIARFPITPLSIISEIAADIALVYAGGEPVAEPAPAPPCEPRLVVLERPAVALEVRVGLAAIALAGLFAAVWPRRYSAGAWVVVAGTASVIAFVLTRGFDIRADETTYLWPYYAVRVLGAGVAACVAAALAWLVVDRG